MSQKNCACKEVYPTYCKEGWRTVFAGSRFTTGAELMYHPVEGEAMAVAWVLEKTRHFTSGDEGLLVAVNHKPLFKILGDRELGDINNTRILNFKEKTLRWTFKVVYVPGPEHTVPDAQGDINWQPWEPRRNCRGDKVPAASMDNLERAMVASTQAAFSWALEDERRDRAAQGLVEATASLPRTRRAAQVHTLSSPRTVSLQEADSASARDTELKEMKELVLADTPALVQEWPDLLQSYFKKGGQYSAVGLPSCSPVGRATGWLYPRHCGSMCSAPSTVATVGLLAWKPGPPRPCSGRA